MPAIRQLRSARFRAALTSANARAGRALCRMPLNFMLLAFVVWKNDPPFSGNTIPQRPKWGA